MKKAGLLYKSIRERIMISYWAVAVISVRLAMTFWAEHEKRKTGRLYPGGSPLSSSKDIPWGVLSYGGIARHPRTTRTT
jgi:hypothetical protein